MQIINRVSFQLPTHGDCESTFDRAVGIIAEWINSRPIVKDKGLVPSAACTTNNVQVGDDVWFEGLAAAYDGNRGWGGRLSHVDAKNDYLHWTTESMLSRAPDGALQFNCTLLIQRIGDFIASVNRHASNPGVVSRLITRIGARTRYNIPLHTKPIIFRNCGTDVARLMDALESRERTHPIVFISPTTDHRHIVDFSRLAQLLAGMAHVIVAEDAEATRRLGHSIPRRLNCFDGGIRVYWPGFRRHSNPLYHQLLLKEDVERLIEQHPNNIDHHLLDLIAKSAAFSVSTDFLTWPRLEGWDRKRAIDEARQKGDAEEMLRLFEEDNTRLEDEKRLLELGRDSQNEEIKKLQAQVYRLQFALEESKGIRHGANKAVEPILSVQEAIERARAEFAEKLIFAFNSQSKHDECPFQEPEDVFQALAWLATTYWDAKTGNKANSDLEHDFRSSLPGWEYRPHQSKLTLKNAKWRSYYVCKYDGREIEIPSHFAFGAGNDPRTTIRIAFAWDDVTRRSVIGFIGQHQPNTKTA